MSEQRRVGRRRVEITHPDKVLFPDAGITKRELVDHYLGVASRMVPHLRDRPLSMQRFPDGIQKPGFYHKTAPDSFPDWVPTAVIPKRSGGEIVQVVVNDAATLCVVANYGCITPHVTLSRLDRPEHPDRLIIDLDPPSDADFEAVRRAAWWTRELLDEVGLPPWLMTTGSRGVHLVVPLDRAADFEAVRGLAKALAGALVERHPHALTTAARKADRGGRVYVDALRNAYGALAVAAYAVRALPGAPVATPIAWDELDRIGPRETTIRTLPERLASRDDPWKGIARRGRSIEGAVDALAALGG